MPSRSRLIPASDPVPASPTSPPNGSRGAGLWTGTAFVVCVAVALAFAVGTAGARWSADGEPARPQTPVPPFPYETSSVTISAGPVALEGVLTLPPGPGPFPAALILSGAGPQDRDGNLAGHKRFVVLADALARAGIASLRTDDRGVGGSDGDWRSARFVDLAEDARACARFLREQPEIDSRRVGLLGGSQGSVISSLTASLDPATAFTVLLAPPSLPGHQFLAEDNVRLARLQGLSDEEARQIGRLVQQAVDITLGPGSAEARAGRLGAIWDRIDELSGAGPGVPGGAAVRKARLETFVSPAMVDALVHDPAVALRALRVPTLVIAGGKDVQVDPRRHMPLLREALAESGAEVKILELPGLNHLLQPASTGLPEEYVSIETTIAPDVLRTVTSWIAEVPPRAPSPPPDPSSPDPSSSVAEAPAAAVGEAASGDLR